MTDMGIQLADLFDIGIIALVLYAILVWFKKTRAAFVLIGLFLAGALYLLARQFNLLLTVQIFQSFLAVFLIGVIVIFQQEIRYFLEQIAIWSLNRKLKNKSVVHLPPHAVEVLVKTLFDLAAEKIGALIVIKGKDILSGHVDGGVELDGHLSEHILKSIFDPHSIGHDGAVIIEGDRLTHLSVHLPLSKDARKLGYGGTRHAAALGLAEVSDAVCLVVSEERSVVSWAEKGEIRRVPDAKTLEKNLEVFYSSMHPSKNENMWTTYFRKNFREKILAVFAAFALWFVQVYSAELIYQSYEIPVTIQNLPRGLAIEGLDTPAVTMSFSGPRRQFFWMGKNDVRLAIDGSSWKKGDRTHRLAESDISFPEDIVLRSISPQTIKLSVEPQKITNEKKAAVKA